jgi:hypothetical protein
MQCRHHGAKTVQQLPKLTKGAAVGWVCDIGIATETLLRADDEQQR